MVKRWILVLIGAVLSVAFTQHGWALTLDYVAGQIEDLQKDVKSCEAKFLMFAFVKDEKDPSFMSIEDRRGTVWFKSPSFWRIEVYDRKTSMQRYTAVCDGKDFWHYIPEAKKVTKKSVKYLSADEKNELVKDMTGKSPLFKMIESARESVISVKENEADQTWELELGPHEYSSQRIPFEYDRVNLSFSNKDGLLRELEICHKGETVYRVIFFKITTNRPISEDKFIFQTPEGVEIEEVR